MTGPRIKLVKHPSTGNVEFTVCESIYMNPTSLCVIPEEGWDIEDPLKQYKDKIRELENRLAYAERAKGWILKNLREINDKVMVVNYWHTSMMEELLAMDKEKYDE
jgi:hypothetical protein